MILIFLLTQTMKYMLLNDPSNDLLRFGFVKIDFRSARSDADEDGCEPQFGEDSGHCSPLEFGQGVLDDSHIILDTSVRYFDRETDWFESPEAFQDDFFFKKRFFLQCE